MSPETIYQAVAGQTHGWRLPLDIDVCDPSGPVRLKPGEPWPDIVIVAVAAAYQRGRSLRQRWFSASGVAEDYNYVYLEQDVCRYRHWFLVPGGGGLLTATQTNGARQYRIRPARGRLTIEYTLLFPYGWPEDNVNTAWYDTRAVAYDFQ